MHVANAVKLVPPPPIHAKIKWNPTVATEMQVDCPSVDVALADLFKDRNAADIQWEGQLELCSLGRSATC